MSTWYGLWHSGNGYGLTDPESDMEQFSSLQAAKDALAARYHLGYSFRQRFQFVNREPESVLTPVVGSDSCLHLFASPDSDPALPDRHVYFGPRGGVRVERL
ncbi:hypothetical protein GCM10027590_32310 [Nocardiopsis nanhaiensis]